MIARDPVAVLREAASLLPHDSAGRGALLVLADRHEFGHDLDGARHTLRKRLGEMGITIRYTPDERAAFALAREALAAGPGVEVAR